MAIVAPAEVHLGIDPIPPDERRLRAIDVGVLWGDLAVGILVLAAGALLVSPSGLNMALGPALAAIVLGSSIGSLLLALVGVAAHDRAVPTMVLLRPVLGRFGSYAASGVNVAQLVGWTAVEFWAMALFLNRVSDEVFGFRAFGLWLGVAAVLCTALTLLGPVAVVRAWLERFGIWIVLAACGYLSVFLLVKADWGQLFASRGPGASFGTGLDLVIALPVSWLPLVADYNRFSTGRRQNFLGTFGGFTIGNAWFFTLGALLILAGGVLDGSPEGLAAGILGLAGGAVMGTVLLLSLLAGEADEAFADIYSSAVSIQNVFPRLPQRMLVVGVSAVATALAAVVTMGSYEIFLFLLGSVFTPLFGVVLAAWASGGLRGPAPASEPGIRPPMVAAWIIGFLTYHWIHPTGPGWWVDLVDVIPGTGRWSGVGASLPAFAVAFLIALAVSRRTAHTR